MKLATFLLLNCGWIAAQSITAFEAPGSGTAAGQGTFAQGISASGKIFGYEVDSSGVAHGFLRFEHAHVLRFDAPGAATASAPATTIKKQVKGTGWNGR